ncbi:MULTISPECIES: hypothetical protein [unclassified Nostoc]|uniref:hypothetical protein n=1 Tax=unclassified Nostoc TaxID=2593658 RepID=UPI0026003203|nr:MULTISPECIES: hypothetical protein [unclassified Nostoc]
MKPSRAQRVSLIVRPLLATLNLGCSLDIPSMNEEGLKETPYCLRRTVGFIIDLGFDDESL